MFDDVEVAQARHAQIDAALCPEIGHDGTSRKGPICASSLGPHDDDALQKPSGYSNLSTPACTCVSCMLRLYMHATAHVNVSLHLQSAHADVSLYMHTEIPTIMDPTATKEYPSATGSMIVGISVARMLATCSRDRNSLRIQVPLLHVHRMVSSWRTAAIAACFSTACALTLTRTLKRCMGCLAIVCSAVQRSAQYHPNRVAYIKNRAV